jgi:hypothetical protein
VAERAEHLCRLPENGERHRTLDPGLVPTAAQRSGILAVAVYDPSTGINYPAGAMVPISQQAQALLDLYPLPNITGNAQYNYQVPLVIDTHSDATNSNVNKTLGRHKYT